MVINILLVNREYYFLFLNKLWISITRFRQFCPLSAFFQDLHLLDFFFTTFPETLSTSLLIASSTAYLSFSCTPKSTRSTKSRYLLSLRWWEAVKMIPESKTLIGILQNDFYWFGHISKLYVSHENLVIFLTLFIQYSIIKIIL